MVMFILLRCTDLQVDINDFDIHVLTQVNNGF
jgi:hypothetical protein